MDQVAGIGDIMGIGSKRTKEGRHVEIKLAAMLSPTIAAQLMSLQDNGKVRFMFEPVIEQQVLPGMDKPQDVPGQLKAVFGRHSTCPQCQAEMDKVAGGWRCPKCGLGVTVDGEVTGEEASEASEDGHDDEGEEDAEEEPGQTEAGPPGVESDELPVVDELAGLRCPKCGGEIERVQSNSGPLLQCVECRHWMTEGEYRARTRRRRWRDPANGKVYEVSQGIGDGWGLFERKGRSSHRVRGVEYQHDRQAVEKAAAEYAERHGWVETTDEEVGDESSAASHGSGPEPDPLDGELVRNSVEDSSYELPGRAYHLPTLTDRELLYCLRKETRTSGRVQLKREIRRRLRARASGEVPDQYPEWTERLRAALNEESGPEEASGDDRPFRPAAGE